MNWHELAVNIGEMHQRYVAEWLECQKAALIELLLSGQPSEAAGTNARQQGCRTRSHKKIPAGDHTCSPIDSHVAARDERRSTL